MDFSGFMVSIDQKIVLKFHFNGLLMDCQWIAEWIVPGFFLWKRSEKLGKKPPSK
jgi:hypothetical protein